MFSLASLGMHQRSTVVRSQGKVPTRAFLGSSGCPHGRAPNRVLGRLPQSAELDALVAVRPLLSARAKAAHDRGQLIATTGWMLRFAPARHNLATEMARTAIRPPSPLWPRCADRAGSDCRVSSEH
jgi:hypothetical protein